MKKELRVGYSTGSCMTGGAAASAIWQLTGTCPDVIKVETPIGKPLYLDADCRRYFEKKLHEIDSMTEEEKHIRNNIMR